MLKVPQKTWRIVRLYTYNLATFSHNVKPAYLTSAPRAVRLTISHLSCAVNVLGFLCMSPRSRCRCGRNCLKCLSWKEANVVPVPTQKPVTFKDVNKHLRLISLTPFLFKIAEDFVVEEFIKPAVTAKIDNNQYVTEPKSSTAQVLVSMVHAWSKHTDGNGATVRVVLFDFRKAFDLIDHAILAKKLENLDLPSGIVSWVIDFLKNRKQRIKLSQNCF